MTKIFSALRNLLLHAPIPYYPFMFGLLAFMWGLWVALPWDAYSISLVFKFAAEFIPETALGLIGMLVGSLLFLGSITSNSSVTRLGMLLSFYFWGFIATSAILGDWQSPLTITAIWLCLMSGLAWANRKIRQNLLFED